MDLKQAEYFLEKIKEIYMKIPKKEKTFMEISGYPHFENVCSNILAFYFNPKEEHGLNDVMLKTLLNIVKEKETSIDTNVNISDIKVFREFTTENGNRIDIVMQNNEIVIGIENKIMARVNNDLTDYANTLEKLNSNSAKILLSFYDESDIANKNGFINITYGEFINKFKNNITNYADTQNKWYIYLVDFIKNLEGFKMEKEMEEEINKWIKNHQEEINDFYELLNTFKNSIDKKINEYGSRVEELNPNYKVKYWNDNDIQVGAYIAISRLGCNLDAVLSVEGWKLGLNLWKKSNQIRIKQALREKEYDILEEFEGRIYLYKLDYNCSIMEAVNRANELLEFLENIV